MSTKQSKNVAEKYLGNAPMQKLLGKYLGTDFEMPEGLSKQGRTAWYEIMKYVVSKIPSPSTGGCKAFYSPRVWEDRGEDYGADSVLIVAHDGGDMASFFNMDQGQYALVEGVQTALSETYAESCTCWYAAIYLT